MLWGMLLICGLALATGPRQAEAALVVLGDSLSDTRNAFNATGGTGGPLFSPALPDSRYPSPPFAERASNGPLWVERLAELLNLPIPQPGLAFPPSSPQGTNFAFIGAVTGPGVLNPFTVPTLQEQTAAYLASGVFAPDNLVAVWGGANDLFNAVTAGVPLDPSVPVGNVVQIYTDLIAAGTTSLLTVNLPLLGETPAFINTPARDPLNFLSLSFNALLAAELDTLAAANPGVTVYRLDAAGIIGGIAANPGAFGFTNVTDAAVPFDPATGIPIRPIVVAPNPDEYLSWDAVHPTARVHDILAQAAFRQIVPEPATAVVWSVLIAGAVAAISVRRRSGP
jgi:outer membrane lipase/esterase